MSGCARATIASVDDDFDGVHRPQGLAYDLGAFEACIGPCLRSGDAGHDVESEAAPDSGADASSDARTPLDSGAFYDGDGIGSNDTAGCGCSAIGASPSNDRARVLSLFVALTLLTRRVASPRPTTPLDRAARARRRW